MVMGIDSVCPLGVCLCRGRIEIGGRKSEEKEIGWGECEWWGS